MALVCLTKPHHSVAGPTPNETNETHCRYKTCVFSYDECLIPTLSRYGSAHGVVHSGTKVGNQVSPHRPSFIPMRGPSGPRPNFRGAKWVFGADVGSDSPDTVELLRALGLDFVDRFRRRCYIRKSE